MLAALIQVRWTLDKMKRDVEQFRFKCNVSKTVGTSVGAVGAVAAAAAFGVAFFTGGTSLLLTTAAIGSSATGAVINVTTVITDHLRSKRYLKDVEIILDALQGNLHDLDAVMADYQQSVRWLMENHHFNIYAAEFIAKQLIRRGTTAMTISENARNDADMARVIRTLRRSHGVGSVSFVLNKSASELTKAELNVLNVYNKTAAKVGSAATKHLLHGTMAAVNMGVTLWEICSLVNDWRRQHPAAEVVDEAISKVDLIQQQLHYLYTLFC